MGVKAIIYFEIVTTLALFIGLAAINISKAGVGVQLPPVAGETIAVPKHTATEVILHIFPENIAKSVAEGQILQVVVFAIIFGIALAMVREDKRKPMLTFVDSLAEVMFKFTNIVMLFAPFGVGAAIAYTVGHTGLGVLANLAKLLATLYVALLIFLFGVLLADRAASSKFRCGSSFEPWRNPHPSPSALPTQKPPSPRHGSHGGDRRSAQSGRVRHADRLQL